MTPPRKLLRPSTEDMVIRDLHRSGKTLIEVLNRDTDLARHKGRKDLIGGINCNLRILAAINEVLIYYNDPGLFCVKENL